MKKYLLIFIICPLLFCCHQGQEPEIPEPEPEEPIEETYQMPCECNKEWYQEESSCKWELPWDYPVKSGSEEWYYLGIEERIEACQIPEDILSSLSSEDLAGICFKNPHLGAISGNFEGKIDFLFERFNGIRELFQREDALQAMLKWYRCAMLKQSEKPINDPDWDYDRIWLGLNFVNVEVLLSSYQSPDDNKEDYVLIMQHLVCGYLFSIWYREIETGSSPVKNFCENIYARAKILLKIDEKNLEKIPDMEQNMVFIYGQVEDRNNEETLRVINELSCKYLTSKQINQ